MRLWTKNYVENFLKEIREILFSREDSCGHENTEYGQKEVDVTYTILELFRNSEFNLPNNDAVKIEPSTGVPSREARAAYYLGCIRGRAMYSDEHDFNPICEEG